MSGLRVRVLSSHAIPSGARHGGGLLETMIDRHDFMPAGTS